MARKKSTKRAAGPKALLTLTEVSKRTGISMPTLQRYKKLFQARIPSVGSGRSQRYKPEALDIFRQLKEENIKKRGRPRKIASATPAPKPRRVVRAKKVTAPASPKKKAPVKRGGLLTLTEIGSRTGISYPTLLRYVKNHIEQIPHVGEGRTRRYRATAVKVFEKLRAKSPRGRAAATPKRKPGRPPGRPPATGAKPVAATRDAGLGARVRSLEASHARLIKAIERLEKAVKQPVRLVVKS